MPTWREVKLFCSKKTLGMLLLTTKSLSSSTKIHSTGSSALETVKRLWKTLVMPQKLTPGLFNSYRCKRIRRSARNTCISNVIWSVACLGTMRARTVSRWPTCSVSSRRTLQMWKHTTTSVNCWLRVLRMSTRSKLMQSSTLSKLLSFQTKSFITETQCFRLPSSD